MSSGFSKRVDILTDWHNKYPDANLDLLAEIILEVWQQAEEDTTERIIKLLKDRWVKSMDENNNITAMGLPVDRKSAMLVTEALIWAVEEMND